MSKTKKFLENIKKHRETKKIDSRLLEEVLKEKKENKDSPMIDASIPTNNFSWYYYSRRE